MSNKDKEIKKKFSDKINEFFDKNIEVKFVLVLSLFAITFIILNRYYGLSKQKIDILFSMPVNLFNSNTSILNIYKIFTNIFYNSQLMLFLNSIIYFIVFSLILKKVVLGREIFKLFLLGSFSGAFLVLFFYNIIPFGNINQGLYYGSSAGIVSLLMATLVLYPNYEANLKSFKFKLKYVFYFVLFGFLIFKQFKITGENIGCLGGAVFGLYYGNVLNRRRELLIMTIINNNISNYLQEKLKEIDKQFSGFSKFVKENGSETDKYKELKKDVITSKEIDLLLDKVSKTGFDSLTEEEKNKLKNISKNKGSNNP